MEISQIIKEIVNSKISAGRVSKGTTIILVNLSKMGDRKITTNNRPNYLT
ncbi:hypothetical protein ICE98_02126 [Lactococcus lactis]|nr:hypothetical protein [Lactococcus lactis]